MGDKEKGPYCESTRRQRRPPARPSTRFSSDRKPTDGIMPRSPAHAVFALSLLACVCPSTLSPTAPFTPLTPPSTRCPLLQKPDATAPAGVKPNRAAALRMRGGSPALNDAELYLEGVGVRAPRPPAPRTRTRIASRCSVQCCFASCTLVAFISVCGVKGEIYSRTLRGLGRYRPGCRG